MSDTAAERLRSALDAAHMRPCELAERSGISKSVISRYLSGKYVPKYAAACKMARVLDVDARYLMAESSLGERIRLLRIERGISADALGAQIGKDRANVYRYEAGMSCPAETLSLLASALRTTPEYLMGWTDEAHQPPTSGVPMDLKQRRQELGLTLEELGEACGVGKSTVRKWETGAIKNMRRDKVLLLAKKLQVDPMMIIDSVDVPSAPSPDERILAAYHAADPIYQQIVLELLESHPKKSTEEIK